MHRLLKDVKILEPQIPLYSAAYATKLNLQNTDYKYWAAIIINVVEFHKTFKTVISDFQNPLFLEINMHPVILKSMEIITKQEGKGTVLPLLLRDKNDEQQLIVSFKNLFLQGVQTPFSYYTFNGFGENSQNHFLPLSARSKEAINETLVQWKTFLEKHSDTDLPNICATAAHKRTHFEYRVAITGNSKNDMLEWITQKQTEQNEDFNAKILFLSFPDRVANGKAWGSNFLEKKKFLEIQFYCLKKNF